MKRTLLKSKIHRATVTEADLHYVGSITIDRNLLEAADIIELERIEIYNVTRGTRLATYVIPGEPGAGEICINGAAAHLVKPGDIVILCTYCEFKKKEIKKHKATVIQVDEKNRVVSKTSMERNTKLSDWL
ncbi:MAG: aspartate 1-decarboxylase [Planctomycetaceae bacterium]